MISKPRFWKKHNELHIVTLKNRDPDILDHLFQKMCYYQKVHSFPIEHIVANVCHGKGGSS